MRTAIVGLGAMGLRHIAAAERAGLELVAICDAKADALNKAGDLVTASVQMFADAELMFAECKPEFVIVASTAPSHASLTTMACETGASHVLCEKPMAVSLAECDEMLAACERNGTQLAINHSRRFFPTSEFVKRTMGSEDFGELRSMTLIGSNMGLAMNGVHFIDLFRFLCNQRPSTVTSWLDAEVLGNPRGPQFQDRSGSVRVETTAGTRLYLDIGADQGHGMTITYGGSTGQIVVHELEGRAQMMCRLADSRLEPTSRYALPGSFTSRNFEAPDLVDGTAALIRALLSGSGYPTGQESRDAIEVLAAAYVSDERDNQRIDVGSSTVDRARTFPWA